jgi:FAD/FMN-containing dehydrogenase
MAAEVIMERRAFCTTAAGALGVAALATPTRALPVTAGSAGREVKLAGGDIQAFRAGLHGSLLVPGDSGYDTARKLWNGAFDRRPALIARCADALDVARCVDFARAHDLLVAVRGGGHSLPGHSSCDGGLMIDLSPMRAVSVDRAARTIRVEPGVLLGEFDRASLDAGLVTTTGTVSHTGVAGLALGGGFGRLARKFGLTCDHLVRADVVTADGRRVTASADENADLFWALRGGGGNFGVVTSFEFRLHEVPASILGGVLVFPFAKPRELLRSFADFTASAPDEFSVMLDIVPTPEGRIVALEICHCGERAAAERDLAKLRKIGPVVRDLVKPTPYLALQSGIDKDYPAGRAYYLKSGFVGDITPRLVDTVVDFLEAGPAPRCLASFLQLGGAITRVKPDATAYWHRNAGHQVLLAGFWDAPADADAPRQRVKAGWETLEPFTEGFYVNLGAGDESTRRIRSTYGGNYERLSALKRRYDPTNLFRLNANIPPAAA